VLRITKYTYYPLVDAVCIGNLRNGDGICMITVSVFCYLVYNPTSGAIHFIHQIT
jgi:hypothetical protein